MKKIVLVAAGILMGGMLLFAAGGRQASGQADGLTVLKMWGNNIQATWNRETAKTSDLYDGSVKSRVWDQFVADLAKNGIKPELTLVMSDQMPTAFQTLLASGRINDYDWIAPIAVDERTRLSLVEQGRLAPLNQAIERYSDGRAKDFYLNNPQTAYLAKLDTLEDGNFYWLTHNGRSWLKDPSVPWGTAMLGLIRQDWLDQLGLPMPKTPDEFYNALVAFRQRDVNGNGLRDEIALVPEEGFGLGIPQWFGLGDSIVSALDGKAVSPWYQSGVKDFFTYMNSLYRAGLIQLTQESGENAANRVGYLTSYSAEFWEEPNINLPAGAAKAYYNPVVIQALPDIPARVHHQGYGYGVYWGSSMHAVPAGSKNLEKTVRLIDYLVSDDFFVLTNRGIKGYNHDENPDGTFTFYHGTEGIDQYVLGYQISGIFRGWNCLFPNYDRTDRAAEYAQLQDQAKQYGYTVEFRKDFYDGFNSNRWPFVMGSEAVLTFPTAKEVERSAAISPDLNTYSNELIASLIMGEKSLANWDGYIADLKRLGLDELIGIFQARMDRLKN
ncbi:MAG: extracellular solute-binding protein [Treponema sp.]|nr:extracellular solute-binding protein [Treponema sp.]